LFRRIGQFIEDIAETIKRERGNLKIIDHKTADSTPVEIKPSDILNDSSAVILSPENPEERLILNTLEDDSPDPKVFGESDNSPPPDFFTEDIGFVPELPHSFSDEVGRDYTVRIETVLLKHDLVISGDTEINKVLADSFFLKNNDLKEREISLREFDQLKIPLSLNDSDGLQEVSVGVETTDLDFEKVRLKTLDSEFSRDQERFFHFEETVDFSTKVSDSELDFEPRLKETIAAAMRFPIKRPPVAKSGYQVEEIKRALTFIIERYGSKGKLKIVGIYKNVPVYSAEKLTFSRDKNLLFYYRKKADTTEERDKIKSKKESSKPFMLDVLVVKSREGKYHVGPIIRTA